jgi:hypothetical protein
MLSEEYGIATDFTSSFVPADGNTEMELSLFISISNVVPFFKLLNLTHSFGSDINTLLPTL